jgi:hypothetical protein
VLPLAPFLARMGCLSGLFKQTRTLKLQVFWIIERLLFADPPAIVRSVKDHFRHLRPFIEEIAKTQSGDADKFLRMLAVSDPEVLPMIEISSTRTSRNSPL